MLTVAYRHKPGIQFPTLPMLQKTTFPNNKFHTLNYKLISVYYKTRPTVRLRDPWLETAIGRKGCLSEASSFRSAVRASGVNKNRQARFFWFVFLSMKKVNIVRYNKKKLESDYLRCSRLTDVASTNIFLSSQVSNNNNTQAINFMPSDVD